MGLLFECEKLRLPEFLTMSSWLSTNKFAISHAGMGSVYLYHTWLQTLLGVPVHNHLFTVKKA